MEKRTARSKTILDIDDYLILSLLDGTFVREDNIKNRILHEYKVAGLKISFLLDKTKLSHKALIVHLNRLKSFNLIQVYRSPENYKYKLLVITKSGQIILDELKKNKSEDDVLNRPAYVVR